MVSMKWSVKPNSLGLTHCSYNLCLQSELVLEASSKVAHTSLAVACNIGNLSDMVEHVSTCEQQDCNQADSSPEITVL